LLRYLPVMPESPADHIKNFSTSVRRNEAAIKISLAGPKNLSLFIVQQQVP